MNNVLTVYYGKLVKNGRCTVDQLPEEYRESVKTHIEGTAEVVQNQEKEFPLEQTSINGALHLPKIENHPFDFTNVQSVEAYFRNENIFTPDVLGNLPFPTDIKYSIERVENVYGKFEDDLNVQIAPSVGGFLIEISGTPRNMVSGDTILRVDLSIKSINYEDMRLTIYFSAV